MGFLHSLCIWGASGVIGETVPQYKQPKSMEEGARWHNLKIKESAKFLEGWSH